MHMLIQRYSRLAGGALALAMMFALPVQAHDHSGPEAPQATLNAQASVVVPQDTVRVSLVAELSADSQTDVAQALNEVLDSVMTQAKDQSIVQVRSGAYRIWPITDRKTKVTQWWGHGEIILTSTDIAAAAELAGKLDDRMPIGGMTFSVSPERRATEEQALLSQAVDAFKARAQALTEALGFQSFTYRTIDLGGDGGQVSPMPRMMMSAMAADKVAAPMEVGTETITVSVHGTILLQPAGKLAHQ
ncbi:MAG: SIMPL domain-containing protein [Alcaligenaceae bacterium]|nr:SIMPL domain-containing protein [Alcaligenaceae bacterium]